MGTKFPIKFYFLTLIFLSVGFTSFSTSIEHICVSQLTRQINILAKVDGDTCNGITKIVYVGFNSSTGQKLRLDSTSSFIRDYTIKKNLFVNLRDSFYIELNLSCSPNKIIKTKALRIDVTPPKTTKLDSVSIQKGKAVMSWPSSTAKDLKGYIIYRSNGVVNNPVDTILGRFNTFYSDTATTLPYRSAYRIAAVDSCNNVADLGPIDSTIGIKIGTKQCQPFIEIFGTDYSGWQASKYELYANENGTGFKLILTSKKAINYFKYLNVKEKATYQFFIRAFQSSNPSITSSSKILDIKSFQLNRPSFFYINRVTALKNHPLIEIKTDSFQFISKINLYASTDSLTYKLINTYSSPFTSASIELLDSRMDLGNPPKKLFYKVDFIDACSNKSKLSKAFRMILPNIVAQGTGGIISFIPINEWNRVRYQLFKNNSFPDSTKWIALNQGDSNITSFIDTSSNEMIGNDGICYYIKATGFPKEDSLFLEESTINSYQVCIPEPLKVYFPNSFVRGGLNPVFKISFLGVDENNSKYQIYNRWGELIFTSSKLSDIWEGTNSNGRFISGVYLVRVFITDKLGNTSQMNGLIHALE